MEATLTLSELAIVLAADVNNPSVLNPDFLVQRGIVPGDWGIEGDAITTPVVAEVRFKNEVRVLSQPNRVTFTEPFRDSGQNQEVPRIADAYAKALPNVRYTALGLNPVGYALAATEEEATSFIARRCILPGPWCELEGSAAMVEATFRYAIEERLTLAIAVAPAALEVDDAKRPILLFKGNFHHDLGNMSLDQRVDEIGAFLRRWQEMVDQYRGYVETAFLT